MHDMPGTTRDAIDTIVETDDGPLRFVDTAGLRRKSQIDEPTEYYGLVRALEAIDRADAALFLIDATEGVTHQDQRLAERVDARRHRDRARARTSGTCSTPSSGPRCAGRSADKLGFLGVRAGAADLRRSPASACTICCRRCAKPRRRTTRACRPRALNRRARATPRPRTRRRCEEAPAAGPLRDAGRDRPADVHAVHDPAAAAQRTCGTWSARCASRSTLGPTPIKIRVRRRDE